MAKTKPYTPCGNNKGGFNVNCRSPADLCGFGWHVCGSTKTGLAEITSSVSETTCSSFLALRLCFTIRSSAHQPLFVLFTRCKPAQSYFSYPRIPGTKGAYRDTTLLLPRQGRTGWKHFRLCEVYYLYLALLELQEPCHAVLSCGSPTHFWRLLSFVCAISRCLVSSA